MRILNTRSPQPHIQSSMREMTVYSEITLDMQIGRVISCLVDKLSPVRLVVAVPGGAAMNLYAERRVHRVKSY